MPQASHSAPSVNDLETVLLVAACAVAVVASRRGRPAIRLTLELSAVATVALTICLRGEAALVLGVHPPRSAHDDLAQPLAVVWWAFAARAAATASTQLLSMGGRTRQARLLTDIVGAAIYIGAVFVVLGSVLGIQVGGLLATSGIVAVVFGLALQSTLADVFSGIAVGLEQTFHVGDLVVLTEGVEGTVVSIGWRSIQVLTEGNDVAIVPNSSVAKATVVNRTLGSAKRRVRVEVAIPSSAAPLRVLELLRRAALLTGGIADPATTQVLLARLGIRTSGYLVQFHVPDDKALLATRSSLLVQVARQLRYAGICETGAPSSAEILRSTTIFAGLGDEEVELLDRSADRLRRDPGELLFAEGAVGEALFVVLDRVLEVERVGAGTAVRKVGLIGPGEYLGEVSVLTGDPRPSTVRALTDASVLEISRDDILALIGRNPGLAPILQAAVERGFRFLDRDEGAREETSGHEAGPLLERIRSFFHRHTREGRG